MIKDNHISAGNLERLGLLAGRFNARADIAALFLIGSQTGRPTPLSDIDIAVLGTKKFSFEQMIDLQYEISACLATTEVDLIDLRSSNPDFAYNTLRAGKPVLVNNELLLADFTAYTCDRVFDFRYHLMECIKG